jgi:hypothetical protein
VQQKYVQGVALYPLPAYKEAAKEANRLLRFDSEGTLHRLGGGQLVGDRADTADPGHKVRGFEKGSPSQEGLEKAWGLENVEPSDPDDTIFYFKLDCPFTLDPGE